MLAERRRGGLVKRSPRLREAARNGFSLIKSYLQTGRIRYDSFPHSGASWIHCGNRYRSKPIHARSWLRRFRCLTFEPRICASKAMLPQLWIMIEWHGQHIQATGDDGDGNGNTETTLRIQDRLAFLPQVAHMKSAGA